MGNYFAGRMLIHPVARTQTPRKLLVDYWHLFLFYLLHVDYKHFEYCFYCIANFSSVASQPWSHSKTSQGPPLSIFVAASNAVPFDFFIAHC